MKVGQTVGAVALVTAVAGAAFYAGVASDGFPSVDEPTEVTVPSGTKLSLILLESLDAGGSKVGDKVELALAEPVVLKNLVALPVGTRATAEISESRGASLAAAVTNRPARLKITLTGVQLPDGRSVPVRTPEGEVVYEFTQANTADRVDSARVDRLWSEPQSRQALTRIAENFIQKQPLDENETELKNLVEALGMEKTRMLMDDQKNPASKRKITLGTAFDALVTGGIGRLTGIDVVLAAQAMGEVTSLVSSVDHKLRGIFKGRTIRATVGTPIDVVTGITVVVPLDPEVQSQKSDFKPKKSVDADGKP